MAANPQTIERVQTYCALCVSRCGAIAVTENGKFTALEPDPTHPTGKALCAKGRAAPELVYHPERLLYPLRRTRPKGDPDPGWERIGWEEAMALTAGRLRRIAAEYGAESVAFSISSPSTTASDDSLQWVLRLMNAFGSPNASISFELCGYGRYLAPMYTFGTSVPGVFMPDLENAGCILFWGYNPNLARLTHATRTVEALKRGAKLIVVDPRRAGLAKKADVWLQVRPGSDGALALGIAGVMIQRGWYDREFVAAWSDGPLLVRDDTGRRLTQADLSAGGSPTRYAAWSDRLGRPVDYNPATGGYEIDPREAALSGAYAVETLQGIVTCRPGFERAADVCRQYPPERVAAICGVEPAQVVEAARLLWEHRPAAYYTWSGIEMQSNATQIVRAIAQLYALTGCFDAPGGNVRFPAASAGDVEGQDLLSAEQRVKTLGLAEKPLGGARLQQITSEELYRGILERQPYGVHALVGFGANLLLAHSDSLRGREALAQLDFYVHADLFMNPTAALADIVLPAASAFEREALKMGFEGSLEGQQRVQLRRRVAEPRGEARSDIEIVFDLACRLGLGEHFWDGDIDAAYRHQLSPSGVTLEALREQPGGVALPLEMRYRKYAEVENGAARGFNTPTRKVELYSQTMLENGYPPLPDYAEPLVSPRSRPDLARRFPLILTCAKHTLFCETQHRALPSLRRKALDPQVELHPADAASRGIRPGDWVSIETPNGSARARARLDGTLQPGVVCGQHGWWQACAEIGAPGYDAFAEEGANYNRIISSAAVDPVSGSVPHRAYVCEVRRVAG